jgi:RHS repeat-associated protein
VTSAGTNTYCYDADGNMTTRNGSPITWYSYNLPNQITQGSNTSQFFYGAGRNRYKEVAFSAAGGSLPAGTETTISINNMFDQIIKPSGAIEYKHYIIAGKSPIAIRTLRSTSTNDTRFLHKDHLGSLVAMTDETGAINQQLSYDAFGKRRSATTWSGTPSITDWTNIAATTHHGFVFHEQLDNLGLVHMNGRVYDPTLGRFISADPTVQQPYMSQSLNRYSYVINNPLSMIDPTGFGFLSDMWDCIVGFIRTFGPLIIAYVFYLYGAPYFSQLLAPAGTLSDGAVTLAGATLSGGVSAVLSAAAAGAGWRDVLKAGLWGAIGAWIGYQVGQGLNAASGAQGKVVPLTNNETGIAVDETTGDPTTRSLFVNGQLNDKKYASANALKMSPRNGSVDLFYNPTDGLIQDTTESAVMKFTGQSALGDQLADVLKNGNYTNLIGHSQGTLIISNALQKLTDEGYYFDNGLTITFYGAAANQNVTEALARSVGATFSMPVQDSFFDLVGNVIGGNTLNPFRIVGSMLATPTLFMGQPISPHSCYPGCAQ